VVGGGNDGVVGLGGGRRRMIYPPLQTCLKRGKTWKTDKESMLIPQAQKPVTQEGKQYKRYFLGSTVTINIKRKKNIAGERVQKRKTIR